MKEEEIFKMKIVPAKERKCSACNKNKQNPCETVKEATKCNELKKKTNVVQKG